MKKTTGIICFTIFIISCISPDFCFALHDDEAIGKGGAWKSDDIKSDQPVSSDTEESIDGKLDKAFEKSPIVIPPMDQESEDQESEDQESEDQESEDQESDNPENKDMETSGSSGQ
jgi:hypothetical protein